MFIYCYSRHTVEKLKECKNGVKKLGVGGCIASQKLPFAYFWNDHKAWVQFLELFSQKYPQAIIKYEKLALSKELVDVRDEYMRVV